MVLMCPLNEVVGQEPNFALLYIEGLAQGLAIVGPRLTFVE